jgi:hypothetical protein
VGSHRCGLVTGECEGVAACELSGDVLRRDGETPLGLAPRGGRVALLECAFGAHQMDRDHRVIDRERAGGVVVGLAVHPRAVIDERDLGEEHGVVGREGDRSAVLEDRIVDAVSRGVRACARESHVRLG